MFILRPISIQSMRFTSKLLVSLFLLSIHTQVFTQNLDPSELDQKAIEKARELSDLLKIIGSKKNNRQIRQGAKDQAMDMFSSDKDSIEVISKKSKIRRKYSIRDYFNHLEGLDQYEDVQIEWKYVMTVENIQLREDGNYYGKLRAYQIFEGQGTNGSTKYKDITEKDIEIKLDNTSIETGEIQKKSFFDLKFGNISVYRIVDDPDIIRP